MALAQELRGQRMLLRLFLVQGIALSLVHFSRRGWGRHSSSGDALLAELNACRKHSPRLLIHGIACRQGIPAERNVSCGHHCMRECGDVS
jgi:hypothetical protein